MGLRHLSCTEPQPERKAAIRAVLYIPPSAASSPSGSI
jgi:hypothetical protein